MATIGQPNGQPMAQTGAVVEALQDEATVGYVPVLPLESLWMGGIEALIALFLHREVTAPVPALKIEGSSPIKSGPAAA